MTNKTNKPNARDKDPQKERELSLYENPIPSRELILEVMTEIGIPVKKNDLAIALDIKES